MAVGKRSKRIGICELCCRDEVVTTIHHLTPKEYGGTFLPTANLCIPCHKQIHALFTNEELAASLNTIKDLQQNGQMNKYLKWIRKQPASKLPRTRKSINVKKK
jgi:5-methylcytosine-specific restriction enzyme A